ncbi:MAG: PilW family protein [Proteobacteria bacterium]|nr:PilW family protein [Pseudomonadota bacterium]
MRSKQLPARRISSTRARQRGLTLIELMVSITITLIVVAALILLFLNVNSTQREMGKVNQQIETGRISTFVLENEIALAGFWENYVPQFDDVTLDAVPANVPTGALPDPCLAYALTPTPSWTQNYMRSLLDIPLQAYDAVPATCTTLLTHQKTGTDVLVIRHADTCIPGAPNCEADTAGKLYFQSSQCGSAQLPSDFDLSTAGFTNMLARDCVTPSLKRKFISDIYYIRDYADTVGDGVPTLVRSRFDLAAGSLAQQPPVPLVEGVEGFRVELGLDTLSSTGAAVDYTKGIIWSDVINRTTPTNRGDGSPDGAFVHCSTTVPCTADQLANVVAVKLYVLARSTATSPGYTDSRTYALGYKPDGTANTVGPFNDNYRRHAFATSIRLNNVAGRRETP